MKSATIFCLLLFTVQFLSAQGFYNDGSLISITAETILMIPDSMVNKGTLVNNGDLRISGTWINEGTYEAGNGQINFNNDQTQIINHNDQSIGNLVISGGGRKEFLANITILSRLHLEEGILVSGNGAKMIFHEDAEITGGNDNAHIQGTVEHHGNGDWLFPIGNGTAYLPVVISNVSSPTAVASLTLHESSVNTTQTQEFDRLSENRYWEVNVTNGDLNQTRITLPLRNENTLSDNFSLLAVAGSNDLNAPFSSLGRSAFNGTLTMGSITSEQSPVFRYITIGRLESDRTIEVFNAVSPNEDGKNDFMRIENIEFFPKNTVTIFNRWGDKVFETSGYNNDTNNFRGRSNTNDKVLPAGIYFYTIDLNDGSAKKTGFLTVK